VAAPAPPAPPARPRLDVGKGPARPVPFAGGPPPVAPPVAPPPAPPAANLDVGKALAPRPAAPPAPPVVAAPEFRGIEAPVKDVLATTSTPAAKPDAPPANFVNPKVEPGKVRWHKTVDEARAAAAKTGKPVLLFQMMGKLDDEFC
jgi:hypothetical protein